VLVKSDHHREISCLHRIRERLVKKKPPWAIKPEGY
jgi:hypothetical protein